MTIQLSGSGGGLFTPYTGITVTSTPSGVSGDVYDITPAPGNTLRVLRLSSGTVNTESGMTVTITNALNEVDLITNDVLDEIDPTGEFYISPNPAGGNISNTSKGLPFVDCQRIVVTKVAGSTAQAINISYIEGRIE